MVAVVTFAVHIQNLRHLLTMCLIWMTNPSWAIMRFIEILILSKSNTKGIPPTAELPEASCQAL